MDRAGVKTDKGSLSQVTVGYTGIVEEFAIAKGKRSILLIACPPRPWIFALCLLLSATMACYFFGLLIPASRTGLTSRNMVDGYGYGNDLSPIWLTTADLVPHKIDPDTPAMEHRIEIGLYGRPLDPSNAADATINYRGFSYPLYTDVYRHSRRPARASVVSRSADPICHCPSRHGWAGGRVLLRGTRPQPVACGDGWPGTCDPLQWSGARRNLRAPADLDRRHPDRRSPGGNAPRQISSGGCPPAGSVNQAASHRPVL